MSAGFPIVVVVVVGGHGVRARTHPTIFFETPTPHQNRSPRAIET